MKQYENLCGKESKEQKVREWRCNPRFYLRKLYQKNFLEAEITRKNRIGISEKDFIKNVTT